MKKTKVNNRSIFNLCILCLQPAGHTSGICHGCLKDLPWLEQHCALCSLPLISHSDDTLICGQCLQKRPNYRRAQALFHYNFPIDHLIGAIKYQRRPQYIGHLARLCARYLDCPDSIDALIPIPMHPFSLMKRGFNQAELLACHLGRLFNRPVYPNLLRKNHLTTKQMLLSRQERLRNQRGAFSCPPHSFKHPLLIDDVMTTGATLSAATQALLDAGAEQVDALVIARTDR